MNALKVIGIFLVIFSIGCTPKTADKVMVEETVEEVIIENMDTLSYGLGILVAQNLKSQGFKGLNADDMATAINDVLEGKSLKLDEASANQVVQDYLAKKDAAQHGTAIEEGAKFLAENGKRPEVTTTESGLQYEVLKEGSGATPKPSDKVQVHYHGTLLNGEVFDSSVDRGTPATFGVTQVIQGWVEGLQLMKEGAKYRFYIPYNLAYGSRGAGGKIGPYATLIFDVELLKINP